MLDIRKFFPKVKSDKKTNQPTIFPEPDSYNEDSKQIAFSLPSVFKHKSRENKDKSLLSDDLEDIENDSDNEEQNNTSDIAILDIKVGEKRKFTPEEEDIYREWKKRHYFLPQNETPELLEKKINQQKLSVEEWKNRLEYTQKQLIRIQSSLEFEEKLLQSLVEKQKTQNNTSKLSSLSAPLIIIPSNNNNNNNIKEHNQDNNINNDKNTL